MRYLPILLIFILIDEISDNYILTIFSQKTLKWEFIFYCLFLVIQAIASPIQAGYSDFYSRKKSLVIALFCSALSLLVMLFYLQNPLLWLLGLVCLVKAGVGNILPIAWAAIADTQSTNFRFSLGLSTAAIAVGYLLLIIMQRFFVSRMTGIIITFLFAVVIYLCIRKFNDIRDKKNNFEEELNNEKSIVKEIHLIIHDFLKQRRTRKALITFLLWEFSFYIVHMQDVDFEIKEFENITPAMALGYLLGIGILGLSKKSDEKMIQIGYLTSLLAFAPIFFINHLINKVLIIAIPCYFIYSMGAAFLVPSLFSILSKERKSNEQGKIYGLIDSVDTFAFLFSSIFVILCSYLKIKPIFVIIFSFLIILISIHYYVEFKKSDTIVK